MERLMELVEKERLTWEELEEIEEIPEVETEDNGMSGQHVGYHWYIAKTKDEEHNIYVK